MILVERSSATRLFGGIGKVDVVFHTTSHEEANALFDFFMRMQNRPVDPYAMRKPGEIENQKTIEAKEITK